MTYRNNESFICSAMQIEEPVVTGWQNSDQDDIEADLEEQK